MYLRRRGVIRWRLASYLVLCSLGSRVACRPARSVAFDNLASLRLVDAVLLGEVCHLIRLFRGDACAFLSASVVHVVGLRRGVEWRRLRRGHTPAGLCKCASARDITYDRRRIIRIDLTRLQVAYRVVEGAGEL